MHCRPNVELRQLRQTRSKLVSLHQSALASPSELEALRGLQPAVRGIGFGQSQTQTSQAGLRRLVSGASEHVTAALLRIHASLPSYASGSGSSESAVGVGVGANTEGTPKKPSHAPCHTPSKGASKGDMHESGSKIASSTKVRSLLCLSAEAVARAFAPPLNLPHCLLHNSVSSSGAVASSSPGRASVAQSSSGEDSSSSDNDDSSVTTSSESDNGPLTDDAFYTTYIPDHLQSLVLLHHIPNLITCLPPLLHFPILFSTLINAFLPHEPLHKHVPQLLILLWKSKTLNRNNTPIFDWCANVARAVGFERRFVLFLSDFYGTKRGGGSRAVRDAFYAFWRRVALWDDVIVEVDSCLGSSLLGGSEKVTKMVRTPRKKDAYARDEDYRDEDAWCRRRREDSSHVLDEETDTVLGKPTYATSAIKMQMAHMALMADSQRLRDLLSDLLDHQDKFNPRRIASEIAALHMPAYLDFLVLCPAPCPCTTGRLCVTALEGWTLAHAGPLLDALAALPPAGPDTALQDTPGAAAIAGGASGVAAGLLERVIPAVILGLAAHVDARGVHVQLETVDPVLQRVSSLLATRPRALARVEAGTARILGRFCRAARVLRRVTGALYIARRVCVALGAAMEMQGFYRHGGFLETDVEGDEEGLEEVRTQIPGILEDIDERMHMCVELFRREPGGLEMIDDAWTLATPHIRGARTRPRVRHRPATPFLATRAKKRKRMPVARRKTDSDPIVVSSDSDGGNREPIKRVKGNQMRNLAAHAIVLVDSDSEEEENVVDEWDISFEVLVGDPLPITEEDNLMI
ncbi:hypothetical protein BC830DRAFT_1216700 [Chytriomyces sp. MP71]|nr:hypothetical protein BC830DRAFT_1216700 [Chytriomyces sp. MP71]